jgi:N-hydroxyarylamine O-acetyltransferase
MNLDPADIDDYCVRIGYSGPREPTAEVLRGIVAAHTAMIPFENIDVLMRPPIRLDLPSLLKKLVRNRRGGYCYEQNLLLLNVLQTVCFSAVGLAARVHRTRPSGVVPPRSHMLLRVDLGEDALVVDVGFGTALTAPLALDAGREQKTPHEYFRFVPVDGEFDLQVKFGDVWTDLCNFSLIAGETLQVALGGAGMVCGGGSFVVGPGNTPLIIAGGEGVAAVT